MQSEDGGEGAEERESLAAMRVHAQENSGPGPAVQNGSADCSSIPW
ncbi:MAG: hypothetical protein MUE47_04200 [Acidobacteria bacterium]|nr:hypothetical protein [Acidobacteriota bacterium]